MSVSTLVTNSSSIVSQFDSDVKPKMQEFVSEKIQVAQSVIQELGNAVASYTNSDNTVKDTSSKYSKDTVRYALTRLNGSAHSPTVEPHTARYNRLMDLLPI